jgi:thiamine pyrophosphate-dependent acetolactate synthase large subunit-like protein
MGDGSMHYAITTLWTAARYQIPVTVVVTELVAAGIADRDRPTSSTRAPFRSASDADTISSHGAHRLAAAHRHIL